MTLARSSTTDGSGSGSSSNSSSSVVAWNVLSDIQLCVAVCIWLTEAWYGEFFGSKVCLKPPVYYQTR